MTSPERTSPNSGQEPRKTLLQSFLEDGSSVKVYVRNLPWSTTEDELKSFFSAAGKVTATLIPKRRERSLGYGFVAFATKAGADKALAEFDQKVLGDREISVQAAILKTDEELKAKRAAARKTRRTKDSRPRSTSRKADEVNESRKETAKEPVPRSEPRKPRQTSRAARTTEKPPADSSVKPPAHKVEDFDSSRTLYLGNLPWTVTETELDSIFSEYQFTKSLVPRFGYNYSRSKGYGLVEFSDRNVMLTVMKDVDSVSIDGRQLVIKEAKPPRAQ